MPQVSRVIVLSQDEWALVDLYWRRSPALKNSDLEDRMRELRNAVNLLLESPA